MYKECGKKRDRLEGAAELVGKLLKNIIDNPNEEKFRTFRRDNVTIKERLTSFKSGIELV